MIILYWLLRVICLTRVYRGLRGCVLFPQRIMTINYSTKRYVSKLEESTCASSNNIMLHATEILNVKRCGRFKKKWIDVRKPQCIHISQRYPLQWQDASWAHSLSHWVYHWRGLRPYRTYSKDKSLFVGTCNFDHALIHSIQSGRSVWLVAQPVFVAM